MPLPINIYELITGQVIEWERENNYLKMLLPDRPTSPKQQYITTRKGKNLLKKLNVL